MERTRRSVCVVGTKATKSAAGVIIGLPKAATTEATAEGHFQGRGRREGWLWICDV